MTEHQTVEYKQIWKDEYLKWICGFANAGGGKLVIGRNNDGEAVGVSQTSKLLEDIPNKVRDILGIMVEVRLLEEDGKALLEIGVEAYPSPVTQRGVLLSQWQHQPDAERCGAGSVSVTEIWTHLGWVATAGAACG